MTLIQTFHGTASNGTPLTAVYAEQPAAAAAFALVFPGSDLPRFVHWGRPLTAPETVINTFDALAPQRVSGALDYTAWPSVLPTQSEAWSGSDRFDVRRDGVELFCKFQVTDIKAETVAAGKTYTMAEKDGYPSWSVASEPKQTPTVTVTAEDVEQCVKLTWTCELDETGLIRQHAEVTNTGEGRLEIGRYELDISDPVARPDRQPEILHPPTRLRPLCVSGPHSARTSPSGASPILHDRPPRLRRHPAAQRWRTRLRFHPRQRLLRARGMERQQRAVRGTTAYTTGVIGGGEVLFGGEISLANGESYTTPWLVGSYGEGLNEVASRFHGYIRRVHRDWLVDHGIAPKPRPVILNTWEAVYFNHDYDTLTALADKAVESGVERFVVDDGWFGARRDDTAGLGDWQISQDVWPDGDKSLKALADYVHGKGLEFGLWFEPEMVNPDSDMFRNHPDWVLKPTAGRLPMQGRTQQVVDLTNPDAYDYIYGAMDKLVSELGIDYIKWDHNKLVTEEVSPLTGRPAAHAQTLAVYRIFTDLKAAHPGLEIESCSSGGGRIDLGILEVADRVWASDCVDPVERADIQRYTSLLVPPEMIGEHVGASPAHSTHRATSQEMRMAMAFFGHMGIEWNLLKEPQEDIDKLSEWTAEFKKHREWFAVDTVVHSDAADPAVRVDGCVMPNKAAAIYRFTQLTTSQTYPSAPVKLPGLDPDAVYVVSPLDVSLDLAKQDIGNGQSPLGWWTADGVKMTGRALAAYGIRPPALHPAQAVLFKVVRI
mgnify:CR=1 FL=1